MATILPLRNKVRSYPWGSRTAIAELLGRPQPSDEPEAELWLGAHPAAPSEVFCDGGWRPLDALIRETPETILGPRSGGALPFLLKVLAAEKPLSIQTHPDADAARRGFAREERAGIDRGADERCYPDPNPKPEILYALTPFDVLSGFRPLAQIRELVARTGLAAPLEGGDAAGVRGLFEHLLALEGAAAETAVARALERAPDLATDPAARWIPRLAEVYPGDLGVLAPIFLHYRRLAPGQAIYTPPGTPHAYLGGMGVELMRPSDNVLRAGLTTKHVDRPELLANLCFDAEPPALLEPAAEPDGRRFDGGGLVLRVLELTPGRASAGLGDEGPTIFLATAGAGEIETRDDRRPFGRGDAFLVPAGAGDVTLAGDATVFLASAAPSDSPF